MSSLKSQAWGLRCDPEGSGSCVSSEISCENPSSEPSLVNISRTSQSDTSVSFFGTIVENRSIDADYQRDQAMKGDEYPVHYLCVDGDLDCECCIERRQGSQLQKYQEARAKSPAWPVLMSEQPSRPAPPPPPPPSHSFLARSREFDEIKDLEQRYKEARARNPPRHAPSFSSTSSSSSSTRPPSSPYLLSSSPTSLRELNEFKELEHRFKEARARTPPRHIQRSPYLLTVCKSDEAPPRKQEVINLEERVNVEQQVVDRQVGRSAAASA